jgi:hypothetical protein
MFQEYAKGAENAESVRGKGCQLHNPDGGMEDDEEARAPSSRRPIASSKRARATRCSPLHQRYLPPAPLVLYARAKARSSPLPGRRAFH